MNKYYNRSVKNFLAFFLTLSALIYMQNATAQNYVINPSTDGGFEGTHGWTILNTSNVNKWIIGTGQSTAGSLGAYISNNNSSNAITNPQVTNSKIYIYKDVIVPLNASSITVSFKYKNAGSDVPAPRCMFERTSAFPNMPTDGNTRLNGAEFLTVLNNSAGWLTYTNANPFTTDRPATYSSAPLIPGTSYRIVFEWSAAYQTSFTQIAPFCSMPSSASISGNMSITPGSNETYSLVSSGGGNFLYTWNLTGGATIVSGQGGSTIVAHFPNGYSSGQIGCNLSCPLPTLSNNGKTSGPLAIDEVSITYIAVPKITSFAPASAEVGSSVNISGEFFGEAIANNIVSLGGIQCPITAASANSITITVPPFATFNNITVLNTTTSLSATSTGKFMPKNSSLAGVSYSGYANLQYGSFEAPVNYTMSYLPNSTDQKFGLADIDGDGKIDIVSFLRTTGVPQIYRNTATSGTIVAGSLTLSSPAGITPSINQTTNVLVADLNNDGKMDIATTNGGSTDGGFANINSSTSGTVSFANSSSILPSSGNYKVGTSFLPVDINLDGRIDILGIGTQATGANAFFSRNTTSGTAFSVSTGNILNTGSYNKLLTDGSFVSGASGDMNGDGKPDVILGGNAQIYVLQNTTTQGASSVKGFTFTEPMYKATAGGNCNTIKLADLDGDGKLDVIATNDASLNISVFRNISNDGSAISLAAIQNFASTLVNKTYGLAVADMNGDGKPDLVFSNAMSSGGGIAYLENTSTLGSISFAPSVTLIIPGVAYSQIEVADIDGDNKPDIIAAGYTSGLTIFRNRQTEAGVITADQLVCSGTIPAEMTSVKEAIFASGTPNYLWQYATSVNGTWNTAAGTATNAAYTPTGTLTANTYFRRRAESSTAIGIYYYTSPLTVKVTTAPTVLTTTPATGCGTTNVNLTATTEAGNTIQWFTASTGGTAIGSVSPWLTPGISATTTYYAGAITSSGCVSSARTSVTATIISALPVISSSTPASRCDEGSVTLAAVASITFETTINWYTAPTGGTPVGTGSTFVTPELNTTTSYYVDATNCIGSTLSRTAVIATVNITPTIISTMPASGCRNTSVGLSAIASAGTLNWYNVASGGSASSSYATVFPSATTTLRYVSAALNGCECPRVAVTATGFDLPTIGSTTSATLCGLNTATVSATSTTGDISWYSASSGGSLLGTGNSFTSPVMVASANYYAVAINSYGCSSSPRSTVAVTYTGATVGVVLNVTAITNSANNVFTAPTMANQTSYIWQRSSNNGLSWTDISASLDAGVTYTGFSGTTGSSSSLTISTALDYMHLYKYRLKLSQTAGCDNYSNAATLYVADVFGTCASGTKLTPTTFFSTPTATFNWTSCWSQSSVSHSSGLGQLNDVNGTNSGGCYQFDASSSGLFVNPTGGTAYITLDLGAIKLINQVYIDALSYQASYTPYTRTYMADFVTGTLSVSTDNSAWTPVVASIVNGYNIFTPSNARYVKISKATASQIGVSNFVVYQYDLTVVPYIRTAPASPIYVSNTETLSPIVIATATGTNTLTYQWTYSSAGISYSTIYNGTANGITASGATTNNLVIPNFGGSTSGTYGNIGYYKITSTQTGGCSVAAIIQANIVAPYYSSNAGSGALQNVGSWNTGASGTGGSAPADFAAGKFFILANSISNTYSLGANWTLGGTLRLNGNQLTLDNYNATIGTLLEGSTTAYVNTNGTGKLNQTVGLTAKLFPVGYSSYTPVTITNNTGTTDNFAASVTDGVLSAGTSGTALTNVINKTWSVSKTTSNTGAGVNLTFAWQADDVSGTVAYPLLYIYVSGAGWVAQPTVGCSSTATSYTYTNYTGSLSNTLFMLKSPLPDLLAFAPAGAGNGVTVTLTGTGFTNVSSVSFGNTAATSFTTNSGALNFDGTNDYVTIADVNALDLINTYSIECWIKPESFGSLKGIVSKYNTAGAIGYALRQNSVAPYTGLNFDGMETANGLFVANRWYHIAVIKNYSTRNLYINGVEVALTGTGTTIAANTDPLIIGADFKNATYFDGSIDEVRIWNTVKAQADVQANMSAEISSSAAGLVAYYNFNSLISTNLTDLVATPKNGTLTNMALTGTSSNWVDGFLQATKIAAVVADGTTGSVSVSTAVGTATLAGFTFLSAPTISYFIPARANMGTTVSITGSNLSNATAVTFGGTSALSYTVVSSTQITAVVSTGTTGNIVVTTPGGTASKAGFVYGVPYVTIDILAAWNQMNTNSQSFPYSASYIKPVTVNSANQNYSGVGKINDAQNKWTNNNSSISLDIASAPLVSYSVTTAEATKFDRFVLPGLNISGTTKIQLRWSVDGFASSLGEFTPGTGAGFALSSIDLISTAVQDAGTIEFRTYFYNGNSDEVTHVTGSSFTSSDGTAPSLYDGAYAVMIYGATRTTPTLGNMADIIKNLGDPSFFITPPTTNSTGSFTYTIDNASVATVNTSRVSISSTGTTTLTATLAATGDYNEATTTAQITVKTAPLLLFANMHKTMGNGSFTINAVSNSSGAITYSSGTPATASILGNTITLVAAGTTLITATQAADGIYNAATATAILTVGTTTNSNPALVWVSGINKTLGNAAFFINTGLSSNSVGTYTYYSGNTNVATLVTYTATLVGPGISILTAVQAANGSYNAGNISTVLTTGIVGKTDPTISDFPAMNKSVNDDSFTLTAPSSNSAGSFFYLSSNPAVAVINGTTVTLTGSGTCNIIAVQYANGSYNAGTISAVLKVSQVFTYTSPNVYTKSTIISSLTPVLLPGTVNAYSVSPVLPRGLAISATTGVISGTPTLVTPNATYTVSAINTGGAATTNLDICVNNVVPTSLAYTTPNVYTVGTGIVILSPTTSGGEITTYTVSPALPDGLVINDQTGEISGTPTAAELVSTYVVTGSNTGGSRTASITVTVNDIAPSQLAYMTPNVLAKGNLITPLAPSYSGGAITDYSVSPNLPSGLSLNSSTGTISGTPTVVNPTLTSYTISGSNNSGSTNTSVQLLVNDAAPSGLSYTSPNVFSKNVPISSLLPTSNGGAVSSYSVSPALPTGLSLNTSSGIISGTSTVITTTATYVVTAINFLGSASADVEITVNEEAPNSLSYTPSVVTATKGVTVISSIPSYSGGTVTAFSIDPALASGVTINSSTGEISGTTSVLLTTALVYTITAINSGGSTTTTFTLTVNDVAPTNLSYSPSSVIAAKDVTSINAIPSVSGGIIVSYSILPELPSGVILNTLTGIISGIPSVLFSLTNYSVTATNSGGYISAPFALTVISCSNPTTGGTISGTQSICSGSIPDKLSNIDLPSGYAGTLQYKWQSSTTDDVSGFTDITGATDTVYQEGAITLATWYKRLVKVSCDASWKESNVIKLSIDLLPPTLSIQSNTAIATNTTTANASITHTCGNATIRGLIYYEYSNTDKLIGDAVVTNVSETGSYSTGAFTASFTSLNPNTRYNTRAHATNPYGTAYSSRTDFRTLANVPDAPTVSNPTPSTLEIVVNVNNNPTTTEFAIEDSINGKYLQANGTRSNTVVWQTATSWGTTTITGLTSGITYFFRVKSRNGDNVETVYGASASGMPVDKPTVTIQSASSITSVSITGNGDITLTNGAYATNRGLIYYEYSNTDKLIGDA
ncbi:MAG: FG-GAP-like repeat-containing protein, partial [Bacteroidota bacterium]